MAHYTWNINTPLGNRLRSGLDDLRAAQHALLDTLGAMNQMTNLQIQAAFGFTDDVISGLAKAELASDVANLNPNAGGAQGAAGGALQQMLDQFS